MDRYTIFDQTGAASAVALARDREPTGKIARRDLEAALQLLAERAQYLTGASGSSIALREDGEMVCRASAGQAAPQVGVEIETRSGLTAESLRTHQMMKWDDADSDPRANRESCKKLGVKSAMVMPLLREQEVVGVFELVAERVSAFEARDAAILTRLAEMALTAVEHADAAQCGLPEISEAERDQALSGNETAAAEPAKSTPVDHEMSSHPSELVALVSAELAQIGSCEACGFPVSQGRTVCVDCEQAGRSGESKPAPLSEIGREESWFQIHSYTIGTLVIAALTIALLALKMR